MVLLLGGGPANFVKGGGTIQTFEDPAAKREYMQLLGLVGAVASARICVEL